MNREQREVVKKVNELLIAYFGMPKRNKKLPDPVDMLVATILSQNTNDNNSYKAFQNLRKKYPTWEDVAKAKQSSVESAIKVAGLGKQKSKAIKNFLEKNYELNNKITLDYLKKIDDSKAIESLISYDGVGVKTTSCVLLFSMDRNICPVDTHVNRTVNRIGIVSEKTPDKTFFALNKNFPDKIAHSFHTNLIRLGREICKPKNPSCGICPLKKLCQYDDKNLLSIKKHKQNDFMLLDNVDSSSKNMK